MMSPPVITEKTYGELCGQAQGIHLIKSSRADKHLELPTASSPNSICTASDSFLMSNNMASWDWSSAFVTDDDWDAVGGVMALLLLQSQLIQWLQI